VKIGGGKEKKWRRRGIKALHCLVRRGLRHSQELFWSKKAGRSLRGEKKKRIAREKKEGTNQIISYTKGSFYQPKKKVADVEKGCAEADDRTGE